MLRRHVLTGLALAPLAHPARAQWVPRQPIRVLVGFAAGGTADIVARIAAEAIQRSSGHAVVVEIRSGALGYIALQATARAPADGYTLGIGIMGNMAVGPAVPGTPIPIDLDAELTPVCNLAGTPMALIARPGAPFATVAELVAHAKARPGQLSYASTGAGSTNRLAAEHFAREAGISLLHIPYRGGAPATLDVMADRVDLFFANVSEVSQQIREAKVRGLALAADRPSPLLPDMPLLTRDYPALNLNNWFGLFGPAGLPADILGSLAKLFTEAMADAATQPLLEPRGLQLLPQLGADFAAYIRQDRARWARVATAGNIRAD